MGFVKVSTVGDPAPGQGKVVQVGKREVALFCVGGQYFALSNECLHAGGPVGEGTVEGDVVRCPWHGWRWNCRTGEAVDNPSAKLPRYEVKVEGMDILVSTDGQ